MSADVDSTLPAAPAVVSDKTAVFGSGIHLENERVDLVLHKFVCTETDVVSCKRKTGQAKRLQTIRLFVSINFLTG